MLLLLLQMPTAADIEDSDDVAASYLWVEETRTTPTYDVIEEDS